MKVYDAIIIGAGPAGLTLGSELSKKHHILVIEKNKVGQTTKAWTTEKKIIDNYKLNKFVIASFGKCYFKSVKDNKFFVYDNFVSLNEKKLLTHFKKKILDNGSKIKENQEFLSIKNKNKEIVRIKTNKGFFSCRLLIDCSGVESKLTKKCDLYQRLFYYLVYGGVYNVKLKDDEISLIETLTSKYPIYYIEVFPLSKTKCVFYTFQYTPYKKDPLKLKKVHNFHINNCYLKNKLKNKKKVRDICGIIPMGLMKKHAVDNIFFFGDTSLIAGPVVGFGFTTILQHYKKFANHISKNLRNDTLTEDFLDYQYSEAEKRNRNLQLILGTIFLRAKPKKIDTLIDMLRTLPTKIVIDLIFLRLTIKQHFLIIERLIEHFGLEELVKLLPKEEYSFITKEAAKIMEEITIEEAEKIFNKFYKKI